MRLLTVNKRRLKYGPGKLCCPFCGAFDSMVTDSRSPLRERSYVRRRRQCKGCGQRFTTEERIVVDWLDYEI